MGIATTKREIIAVLAHRGPAEFGQLNSAIINASSGEISEALTELTNERVVKKAGVSWSLVETSVAKALDPKPWAYGLLGDTKNPAREATQVTGGFVFYPRPEYEQDRAAYDKAATPAAPNVEREMFGEHYADKMAIAIGEADENNIGIRSLGGGIPATTAVLGLHITDEPNRDVYVKLSPAALRMIRALPEEADVHLWPVTTHIDDAMDFIITVTDGETAQFGPTRNLVVTIDGTEPLEFEMHTEPEERITLTTDQALDVVLRWAAQEDGTARGFTSVDHEDGGPTFILMVASGVGISSDDWAESSDGGYELKDFPFLISYSITEEML